MSLKVVVAAPFRQRGRDRLAESEFVVALSLDRGWFSPDQAEQLLEVALEDDLLRREEETLKPTFDLERVEIPADFEPDEALLDRVPPFEQILDAMVAAGFEKQTVVAAINRLQADLSITIEAAAVLYARRNGVDVPEAAERARAELLE